MSAKILVVDDDAVARAKMCELLHKEGLETTEAVDGKTALDQFSKERPDLVLLDVVMPEPDGFEVCRILKGDLESRLTPVLLLTSLGSIEHRVKGIEAGANEFLSKPVDTVELTARVRALLRAKRFTDDLEHAESVVLVIAGAIEARDPCTGGHCQRLSAYGRRLADRIGLGRQDVEACRIGGIVHDIGKVTVPDAVLMKPAKLSDDEWEIMKQHTTRGEEICRGLKSFRRVLPIIRHHHEKADGCGYPDGLSGNDIPETVRVVQVVDIYDAMTTDRPYSKAFSPERAFEIIREEVSKGWRDPDICEQFIAMMEEV